MKTHHQSTSSSKCFIWKHANNHYYYTSKTGSDARLLSKSRLSVLPQVVWYKKLSCCKETVRLSRGSALAKI